MKKYIHLALVAVLFSCFVGVNPSFANRSIDKKYFQVVSTEVKEVVPDATQIYSSLLDAAANCNDTNHNSLDGDWADWIDKIILVGKKVIEVIKEGRPVINIKRDTYAALPERIEKWTALGCWQIPVTKAYNITMKNGYGAKVVDFTLKVTAAHNGSYNGVGKFLANVTFIPTYVRVLWGYTLDVWAEAREPLNMGSKTNPIAGLGIDLRYSARTILVEINGTQDYFITGDGKINEMH